MRAGFVSMPLCATVLVTLVGCGGTSEEDCDEIARRIKERADKDGLDQPCGPRDAPEHDAPGYEASCNALRECLDDT